MNSNFITNWLQVIISMLLHVFLVYNKYIKHGLLYSELLVRGSVPRARLIFTKRGFGSDSLHSSLRKMYGVLPHKICTAMCARPACLSEHAHTHLSIKIIENRYYWYKYSWLLHWSICRIWKYQLMKKDS